MLRVSRTPAIAGRWISCSSRLLPCRSLSSPRPPSAATSSVVRTTPRSAGPCANVTGRGTVTVTAAAAATAAPSNPRLFAGHQLAPVSSTVIAGTPAIFGPSPLSSSMFSTSTPTAGRPPCADSTSTGKAGVPPTPNPRVYSGAAPRAVSTSLGSLRAPPTPGVAVAGKLQTSKSSNCARQSFGSVRHPMRIGVPGPWSASGSRYFSDDAIQRFQRYDSVLPSDSRVLSSASAQIPRKFWYYDRSYFGCTTTFPIFTPDAYCNEVRLVDRVPVDIPILGEVNPVLPHLLLREEGKPFCHGILLDIDRMNRLGFSLRNPLTEEDVLVDGHGRLMLKDGVPIIAKTRFSTNIDFRSTSITMKRLLLNSIPQEDRYLNLPLDFLDLCYDLENNRIEKGYPQIYPAALLPLHLRGTAYMDLYDFVTSKACPAHVRKYVITESPYRIYWQTTAEGNVILGEWFFPSRVTLTDDEDYTDFWRHVRCHRFMYRKIWDYTVDELERVIQFKTPLMMPVLYKRLWNAGRRLPNLKGHRLFTYHFQAT